jgi:ADP-heptose:LPS heptosyltransferase
LEKLTSPLPEDYPISEAIVLAPSATWEMKRWPTAYWSQLATSLPTQKFILLAGVDDTFCDDIIKKSPNNILNLRGHLTWVQSTQIILQAKAIISGDTGLLHVADVMGKPAVAIIGPTAFGFPSRKTSIVAEINLKCRPCTKDGRGRCVNSEYKKCLIRITPKMVATKFTELNA